MTHRRECAGAVLECTQLRRVLDQRRPRFLNVSVTLGSLESRFLTFDIVSQVNPSPRVVDSKARPRISPTSVSVGATTCAIRYSTYPAGYYAPRAPENDK